MLHNYLASSKFLLNISQDCCSSEKLSLIKLTKEILLHELSHEPEKSYFQNLCCNVARHRFSELPHSGSSFLEYSSIKRLPSQHYCWHPISSLCPFLMPFLVVRPRWLLVSHPFVTIQMFLLHYKEWPEQLHHWPPVLPASPAAEKDYSVFPSRILSENGLGPKKLLRHYSGMGGEGGSLLSWRHESDIVLWMPYITEFIPHNDL